MALLSPLGAGLAWAALTLGAAQDGPDDRFPPGAEGPLANDVFLPVERAVDELFTRGDEALARARTAAADPATARDAERLYNEAFDGWRTALAAAPEGSSVVHPSQREATPGRLTEGSAAALLARIVALTPEERAVWRARVAEPVEAARAAAGRDAEPHRGIERGYPGTELAVRSGLLLADRAIASGRSERARSWCARALRHLALLDGAEPAASLASALARRQSWLDTEERDYAPAPWSGGDRLLALGSHTWRPEQRWDRGLPKPGPGRGVRPGAALLADGRLAVQTASRVILLRLDAAKGPIQEAGFEPAELIGDALERPPDVRRADGAPGWPLLPATDGDALYVVQGRAELLDLFRRDAEPIANALACIEPPPPTQDLLTTDELPTLRWAVLGDLRVGPDGAVSTEPGLAELRGAEIQPGPLVVGDTVVAQARTLESEVRAWLLGFSAADGSLLWTRYLAKGSDLTEERGRFSAGASRRSAAQPLALVDGLVFASTHLGSGHLVDPLDGRMLWSFRPRRRPAGAGGWSGDRPRRTPADGGPGELLWAPADSDRLYWLAAAELTPRDDALGALLARPPLAIGEAAALLGAGEPGGVVLQGRAGRQRTVFWSSVDGAERREAVYLGRAERFSGVGATSAGRALAASDRGLYLFDLERELYLLDYAGLPPLEGASGGELFLSGDTVVVVGQNGVWAFRTVR
ncbi:MAG: hypothetical protein AAF682_19365 [Planctomycetota bacterium]